MYRILFNNNVLLIVLSHYMCIAKITMKFRRNQYVSCIKTFAYLLLNYFGFGSMWDIQGYE